MTILDHLVNALKQAATYNRHELAAPRVILWPDEERLWVQSIDALREHYPTLWTLGEYVPDKASGPAAWLRYQLDTVSSSDIPVLYLPGVGRAAFRNADQCPSQAKHLFALQFQGQFWTQRNGKDWTPYAYFSAKESGLGLDIAGDADTRKAIYECLPILLGMELDELRGQRFNGAKIRSIVMDPVRTVLRWMGDPHKVQQQLQKSSADWTIFCALCRDIYHFNPESEGALTAAEKLSSGKGAWVQVWQHYREVPRAYPGVKDILEQVPGPARNLFERPSEYLPRSNQEMEEQLERDLLSLSSIEHKQAIETIQTFAGEHSYRTTWVWASLGYAPLAQAIGPLRDLALIAQTSSTPTTWDALAAYYTLTGWKADRSVMQALDAARSTSSTKAVATAIRAIYLPWLEKFAALAQALTTSYPTREPTMGRSLPVEQGTVYVFADGLRMDLARSLEEVLLASGHDVTFSHTWSALPTVTATAKPAWQPLADKLGGPLDGTVFQPREQSTGRVLVHARFKQLITELGITFLEPNDLDLPTGCAWTEVGLFDRYGHEQGAKLAWRLEEELNGLQQRINELLRAGWAKVVVVTDHGWLMLPGGLPKVELPKHLTESKWGRCAIPGPGAQHGYPVTAWYWDPAEAVVLAPGVSCFVAGMEYAHGGLTMQEALIPSLTVTAKRDGGVAKTLSLLSAKWNGLRLNVVFEGVQGLTVDIRSKVADPATSFVTSPATGGADGQKTSLLIADDEALGAAAFLVVIDSNGQPVFKQAIVIGEE